MPSIRYRTYPKSIKNILIHISNVRNEKILLKNFIDEIDKFSKTDTLLDLGHCLHRGLIAFDECEDIYEEVSVNYYKSVLFDAFSGTNYTLVLKKIYSENIDVSLRITLKGEEYLKSYRKQAWLHYTYPIIVIVSIVLFALISCIMS
ncbi:hypothetical protein M2475_001812 [Breznakia sp. PF5-3]|uniref:hypothetical protein n=1 Tax=unclassified Breznakia TaxID=2623764 RepID=UPI0024052A72|nr:MULTISPECIES: hypothetical protein [unclassified Breznakia]MDF9825357.1 hypothetical protein [Breznakia sp. PM6-1]MDF9836235.1 hypothetical protein [Breznakia sp. PF5-3]MDF9838525.1 hypothetical protein [Breznakia sp. PFB2-8]MDF9860480.1 hypothetical protein [Breznakia sp. PH5-24]